MVQDSTRRWSLANQAAKFLLPVLPHLFPAHTFKITLFSCEREQESGQLILSFIVFFLLLLWLSSYCFNRKVFNQGKAKGSETSWWFPEGENVRLIRVFLSQDGVDNTKHVITRSRYASDPHQQPCEWMAHFLSRLLQSEADKKRLVQQSVFVRDPWMHLWKTSVFSQARKT